MQTENRIEYIKTGLGLAADRKLHIKISSGPLLMSLMLGLVPGIVLKGAWLVISMMTIAITAAAVIVVAIISSKEMTVKNRLIMQVIECISFILAFCLVDIMFYAIEFGFNAYAAMIFLPPVLTPVLLGMMTSKKINSDDPFIPKNMTRSMLASCAIGAGIACIAFAALAFKDAEQGDKIIVILVLSAVITAVMSVGLLGIQRLYYLDKLNKDGVVVE